MKIVFFGTPPFAAQFLAGLLAEPMIEVVAVVTQPDELVGRKRILTAPPVKALALQHHLPIFQPTKLKDQDFQTHLKNSGAEIGVVVAYGRILPDSLLALFQLCCINVHPSLLPKYRGPSPIIAALVNGDSQTAVTIIRLVTDMDAGPILAQTSLSISADETQDSLTEKIVAVGVPLLNKTLKAYAALTIVPKEQDHTRATFCKLLTRADSEIDWSQPAEVIERLVRAYNPWPGTTGHGLKIFGVRVTDQTLLAPGAMSSIDSRLWVGTGTATLEILELQPAGGKRMTAAEYLRGRPKLPTL